jgi:hypothetical protein
MNFSSHLFCSHFSHTQDPIFLEEEINENLSNCRFVFYPLSPTIATPTNISMLPPVEEEIDYRNEEELIEATTEKGNDQDRSFSRVACNPFSCYRGHGVDPGPPDSEEDEEGNPLLPEEKEEDLENPEVLAKKDPMALRAALDREKERDEAEGKQEVSGAPRPDDPCLYLIEKVLPTNVSQLLHELLDKVCPRLSSSKLLEEKVLRICLSYGHEMCLIQPEIISLLGKVKVQKKDLLTLDEVDPIFGGFMVPKEVDDILREVNHPADDEDGDGYDRYGRTFDADAESDEELEALRQQMIKEGNNGGISDAELQKQMEKEYGTPLFGEGLPPVLKTPAQSQSGSAPPSFFVPKKHTQKKSSPKKRKK